MLFERAAGKGVSADVWEAKRCIQKRDWMDVANAGANSMDFKKNYKRCFTRMRIR